MKEVSTTRQADVAVAPQSETDNLMSVIQRAATDTNCDIEKMERLMAMKERMDSRLAEEAFNSAFAVMQNSIPTIIQNGRNDHTKNSYAKLSDINSVVRPILQEHGFGVTYKVENPDISTVRITGILMHSGGHRESTTITLPADLGKGRNDVQALGSSVTYGRRYVLCSLLNITTSDMLDDDGVGANQGPSAPPITKHQLERLQRAVSKCSPVVQDAFAGHWPDPSQMPTTAYDAEINSIESAAIKYQAKLAKAAAQEKTDD